MTEAVSSRSGSARRVVEVFLTGVGGQGIQLVSRTLALAAVADGRQAMMVGHYGGSIRGGPTEGTVVIAEGTLRSLPIIPSAWSAFVMSTEFWDVIRDRVRPGGPVVANSSLLPDGWVSEVEAGGLRVFAVPADAIASDLGAPMSSGFVLLGAYAAVTGVAAADSLVDAMQRQVPSYRKANVAANETAIREGFTAAPYLAAPAFEHAVAAGRPQ